MIIAVASGKGGTGKTTVATNLALTRPDITLLDCDVEEPNVHLFIEGTPLGKPMPVYLPVPVINDSLCNRCGECATFCEYKALAVLDKQVLVFEELCHGCGGCTLVCPQQAITEKQKPIGTVQRATHNTTTLIHGTLNVGVAMSPPLIKAVKSQIPAQGTSILDAPPGTACPMVSTLRSCDGALLVTEPTPFGLHDLKLAVAVIREMALPFGVVINRADGGDNRTINYCKQEGIPILAQIPDDRRIAEAYSRGELIVEALPEYRSIFTELWQNIDRDLNHQKAANKSEGGTI